MNRFQYSLSNKSNLYSKHAKTKHTKTKHTKYPYIWTATYININDPSKLYLYVSRKDGKGTHRLSVQAAKYSNKLKENGIYERILLDIPSECPVFNEQQLKTLYKLNDIQCQQAIQTTKFLWNIMRSDTTKSNTQQSCNSNTLYDNNHNTTNGSVDQRALNQINNRLNNIEVIGNTFGKKLDLLINKSEKENQHIKFQLMQKTNLLNIAQDTIKKQDKLITNMAQKIKAISEYGNVTMDTHTYDHNCKKRALSNVIIQHQPPAKKPHLSMSYSNAVEPTNSSLTILTVDALKQQYLRPLGLKVRGSAKRDLIKRILQYYKHNHK
eukprot:209791_1